MPILNLPQASPYPGAYYSVGANICPPTEGFRAAPFSLAWAELASNTLGYLIDFTNQPNTPKQISTLYVDNARSHQGVIIVFPDTGFRLVVPAFRRGYYPVITMSTRFFAGITDLAAANASNDQTVIYALNYSVPPCETDVPINAVSFVGGFDSSIASGPTNINIATGALLRLREVEVSLAGMTAAVGGFAGIFSLLNDTGSLVAQASIFLVAGEFVDRGELLQLRNLNVAAVQWSYTWAISGALTAGASGQFNIMADLFEGL